MRPGTAAAVGPPDDPAQVAAAVRRAGLLAARLEAADEALVADATRLGTGWRGPASAAARGELVTAGALLRRVPAPLRAGAAALRDYARELDLTVGVLARLDSAYADACLRQLRERAATTTAASVLPHPVGARLRADLEEAQRAELRRLQARRSDARQDLATAARRCATRLRAAAEQVVAVRARVRGPVTAQEAALAAVLPMLAAQRARSVTGGVPGAVPVPTADPALVAGWWATLTGDERARLVRAHPAAVARLVGLPSAVLDAASRRVLGRVLLRGLAGAQVSQSRLAAALAVSAALGSARADRDASGRPLAVRLLGFAPGAFNGQGRVVVAVGDPDTADNVAYLVPGMGSELVGGVAGLAAAATRVTTAARRLAPGETTATVGWLGYDAPGLSTVGGEGAAVAGGARLARTLRAVAARPVAPHLTLVGHSYGSVVVGMAQRAGPTGAGDVVLLGSPGPAVSSASALHVPPGHVFVGASSRDPVSYLDRFGLDPTHERFGAVRFRAEDPSRNPSRLAMADHSKYYRPGSESLGNVARVVVGDGDQVARAPYRHELHLRPDGLSADPEADRSPAPISPVPLARSP